MLKIDQSMAVQKSSEAKIDQIFWGKKKKKKKLNNILLVKIRCLKQKLVKNFQN